MNRSKRLAFTLSELIIVLLIAAGILAILMPIFLHENEENEKPPQNTTTQTETAPNLTIEGRQFDCRVETGNGQIVVKIEPID